MHSYLRAIGFSKINNKSEQNKLITTILNHSNDFREIELPSGVRFTQINKFLGENIGLSIIGEYDEEGYFNIDHSFPYCNGVFKTSQSDIQIELHSDKEAYSVVSDDYNLGMSLVYHLNNISDYKEIICFNNPYFISKKIKFGALSIDGKILCGIHLDYIAQPYENQPISNKERKKLVDKAKSGDLDAYEKLTINDMDTYALVQKRIQEEDIFTVVETYFMPYGIDNEKYSIMGIIIDMKEIINDFSGEMVYNLSILCNDIKLNVAINSYDLQGEPKIGRRFKGIIWLQGKVNFITK